METGNSIRNQAELACPITFVLDILGAKWTIEILRELFFQPTRTRRFLSLIPGLNMKTLRERLKMLESYELITRTVYDDLPLRVEYSLTDKGRELYAVLVSLKTLGSRWLDNNCTCSFERACAGDSMDCPHRGTVRSK